MVGVWEGESPHPCTSAGLWEPAGPPGVPPPGLDIRKFGMALGSGMAKKWRLFCVTRAARPLARTGFRHHRIALHGAPFGVM